MLRHAEGHHSINEIKGRNHLQHRAHTTVPRNDLWHEDFQAVSVGQKLVLRKRNGQTGGYLDATGTPGDPLLGEIKFVDVVDRCLPLRN